MAKLMDYETGTEIREATEAEARESREAAEGDGGAGVIRVGRERRVSGMTIEQVANAAKAHVAKREGVERVALGSELENHEACDYAGDADAVLFYGRPNPGAERTWYFAGWVAELAREADA